MERLAKLKKRLILYGISLAVLVLLLLASLWTVIGTGAFLTSENDWQGLAGDYRIGTIDYTVRVNDSYFLQDGVTIYNLAVPIQGGVRIFDPTLTGKELRDAEFGEGCTLVRVRVTNHSASMVSVTEKLTLAGNSEIRMLPLPLEFDQTTAERLKDRAYVLDALKVPEPDVLNKDNATAAGQAARTQAEKDALAKLQTAYLQYYTADGVTEYAHEFKIGLLSGAVDKSTSADVPEGAVLEGEKYCFYKDVFFLVWCEYSEDYDSAYTSAPALPQAQFSAKFTVGQMD